MSGSPCKEFWSRPDPEVTGPTRKAGGFYRLAEDAQAKRKSVPLTEAEDAIVAAVRMAYGVASAQVERSGRLAQRLREAGDRATGERSDRKAIDATEQLVFRAMMSALAWLEGLAAEGDSPLKRLVLAQYRILGSVLGIDPAEAVRPPPDAAMGQPEAATAPRSAPSPRSTSMTIAFGDGVRRPVRDSRLRMTRGGDYKGEIDLYSPKSGAPLKASLEIDERGHGKIWLTLEAQTPSGWWTAAVCRDDVQIGIAEIEL